MSRKTGKLLDDACHHLAFHAEKAMWVLDDLKNSPLADKAYTIKGRTKTPARIRKKIDEHREKAKPGTPNYKYDTNSIEDAFGIRIVTLFQNDIPEVVRTLIEMISHDPSFARLPFVKNSLREIIVYTSRPEVDPFSISAQVSQIVTESGFAAKLKPPKSRATGYSSVHMIVEVHVTPAPGEKGFNLPMEIQVRDIYEEAWGEIDHRLRYKPDGRRLGDDDPMIRAWLTNLNSLKTFCDGCSQQAWIIKERPLSEGTPPSAPTDAKPFESTQEAISALRPILPNEFFDQIELAYTSRARAERSVDYLRREALFSRTEREFVKLRNQAGEHLDKLVDNKRTLDAFLRLEIAFCQYNRNQSDSVDEAINEYRQLEAEYPEDAIVLYRLGMALLFKADLCHADGNTDEAGTIAAQALQKFNLARKRAKADKALNTSHWIHGAVDRNYGYTLWLSTEIANGLSKKARRQKLQEAIEVTKNAVNSTKKFNSRNEQIKSLNNQIYYLYTYLSAGFPEIKGLVTKTILKRHLNDLIKLVDLPRYANIDILDTMCKASSFVDERDIAARIANRGLEVLHASALQRSGQPSLQLIKLTDHLHTLEEAAMRTFAIHVVTSLVGVGVDDFVNLLKEA